MRISIPAFVCSVLATCFVLETCFVLAPVPASAQDAVTNKSYWGTPSVDGGKCCNSLTEVRTNIDRIDHEMIRLMAERGKYVAEAGRFKANPKAVSVPARVEQIILKVREIARENGLSDVVAEKTYRAMIAAFEDYEREEWVRRGDPGLSQPKQ